MLRTVRTEPAGEGGRAHEGEQILDVGEALVGLADDEGGARSSYCTQWRRTRRRAQVVLPPPRLPRGRCCSPRGHSAPWTETGWG